MLTHLRHVQKKYTQPTKNNPDGHPDYKPKKVQDFKGNWTMVNGRLGGLRVVVEDVSYCVFNLYLNFHRDVHLYFVLPPQVGLVR